MAKKDKKDKKSRKTKGKGTRKEERELQKKAKAEAAKAERKQQRKDAKGGKKGKGAGDVAAQPDLTAQPEAAPQPAAPAAGAPGREPLDQVALLKLALRDTEAKLVAAEHRLHQVQQQLDDERRALAEATGSLEEEQEAVVDAAVAETVAEAVVAAELAAAATTTGAPGPADPAERAAAALEGAAEAIDAALAGEAALDGGEREEQDHRASAHRNDLTPPLPEHGPDDEPNESWTLVHLRKEAERRGITGVSNLPKAALVERLRG